MLAVFATFRRRAGETVLKAPDALGSCGSLRALAPLVRSSLTCLCHHRIAGRSCWLTRVLRETLRVSRHDKRAPLSNHFALANAVGAKLLPALARENAGVLRRTCSARPSSSRSLVPLAYKNVERSAPSGPTRTVLVGLHRATKHRPSCLSDEADRHFRPLSVSAPGRLHRRSGSVSERFLPSTVSRRRRRDYARRAPGGRVPRSPRSSSRPGR